MKEAAVEQYLRERVRDLGGLAIKIVPASAVGLPDRVVLLDGQCWWVEVKRPGEKPRASQIRRHAQLRRAGARVVVLDSREAIDEWLMTTSGK